MKRILLRLVIVLLLLAVMLVVLGPLIIDNDPAIAKQPDEIDVDEVTFGFVGMPSEHSDGLKLHVRDSSRAREAAAGSLSFVLLHGFTFNLFTWNELFDFFAQQGRSIAYDQLPYGLSSKLLPEPEAATSVYGQVAAVNRLLTLLDELGISRTVLVGNSSGATLALAAARQAPERVAGLILINPFIYSDRPTLPAWLANTPQMQRITLRLARYLGGEMPLLERSFADPASISPRRRELAASHHWDRGWDLAWGELLQRSLTDPVTISQSLDQITQPTLVLSGAKDQIVKPTDSERAANAMPNAEFLLLPGCGHAPQEECPQLVERAIANWSGSAFTDE